MKRSSKKRVRYDRILIVFIFLIIVIFGISLLFNKDREIYMLDVTNKNIELVK